jgi:hypothetical protein
MSKTTFSVLLRPLRVHFYDRKVVHFEKTLGIEFNFTYMSLLDKEETEKNKNKKKKKIIMKKLKKLKNII